ncbi:MAG: DUF3267 domain-containing protein [Candidatus Dormibacteraeota bacterium]|nr:DUF3267 domain-containing protein [Candidatus Dormibacteraeota bacterium]
MATLADSEELAGTWALGALGAFVVSAAGTGALAFKLYATLQITWLNALVGLLLTIVAHEAVHALAMRAVGGRPRLTWGFRRLLPYLQVGSGVRLGRRRALVSMLAPLILVDLAGLALLLLPATSGIGLVVVVANTTGSVPDLWRAAQLARLPRWIQCDLRGPTVVIWAPAEHDGDRIRFGLAPAPVTPPLVGVLGTWAFCLLIAEAVCAGAVRLAAQWNGAVRVGGVLLASTEQFVSGPDVVLNFLPLALAGGALGTLAAAMWLLVVQVAPRGGRQADPRRRVALRHS